MPGRTEKRLADDGSAGDLFFDGVHIFRGKSDEFHSDAHAGQAITNLSSGMNFNSGPVQPEAKLHDRTLGKALGRIDEHAVRTDIRRARGDLFGVALVS